MEKAVVITGMTKQYSSGRGIKNIDLTINAGEIVGILGPNGAGKTTLLKCMTGLASLDRGKIELFGVDLQNNYKKAIAPVGALIGPAAAYEKMSSYKNLKMISRLYSGITDTDIELVLQQTGLIPYKDDKISSFSMGMKQRFGIASALLSKPRLIVLDEPTNGLDIDGLLLLRKTILEISCQTGATFVISSHHISELEKLCNRFCFLINGAVSLFEAGNEPLEDVYVRKVEVAGR
ncbi:ABC transporter ATP-binding protein [Neobacillus sp. DY30]|uniref:ABC transporter ATP-binding protein n=1 Tax=Neobacillus sp. DY30 TaxID=3047871 RepID=UPI0024BFCF68|nr:ABC transporter ATP-binding protein [Neobacillus sp. DY30]WHY02149.1 ABC transporter ATP-binding protein [Neobacillus sp. DY30]